MKARNNIVLTALLLAAASASAQETAAPPQWQVSDAAQYVCGGVSDEGMAAITAQRSAANGELLFTGGPEGAYLANVAVRVQGTSLKQALSFTANGPLCLLKLPNGSYTVDAEYKGRTITHRINIGNSLQQSKFNWPTS